MQNNKSYFTYGNFESNTPSIGNTAKFDCLDLSGPPCTRQGKKGGNFETSIRFTETNPFLYCLSSSILNVKRSLIFYLRSNLLPRSKLR